MSNATDDAMKQALIEIKKGCHAYQPDIRTSYGYVPSLAAGIVFCILFAVPLFYHTFQSIRLRATVSILLALGALSKSVPGFRPVILPIKSVSHCLPPTKW